MNSSYHLSNRIKKKLNFIEIKKKKKVFMKHKYMLNIKVIEI